MSDGRDILRAYRDLEGLALRMAELARARDWDAVTGAGREYVAAITALAAMERDCVLGRAERDAKFHSLERMLEHDLEIRSRLLEHREELAQAMARSRNERSLNRAYGAVGIAHIGQRRPTP